MLKNGFVLLFLKTDLNIRFYLLLRQSSFPLFLGFAYHPQLFFNPSKFRVFGNYLVTIRPFLPNNFNE
tara:strand:- start:31017 stop:31220 length:204 start_codon:yes stop_codon:yes gene_type:complete